MGLFGLGKSGSDTGADKQDDKGKDPTKINDGGKQEPDNKEPDKKDTGKQDDKGKGEYSEEAVKKLIDSAIKEATSGFAQENESLKEQIKELSRKGLTPEQIAELEKKDREAEQNKREAEITERENRFYALTAIKDAGLDDGGKTALELIDLVMGKDQKEIDSKVKALDSLVKRMVKSEVDKTFKDSGRSPKSGDDDEDKNKENALAKELGKRTANANKQARSVLEMYMGGNK